MSSIGRSTLTITETAFCYFVKNCVLHSKLQLGRSALTITAVTQTDQGDFRAEIVDAAGGPWFKRTCLVLLFI